MPSSYSPDLRLELPADGEQTALWGQLVNRNLGTLIEAAISGVATVSVTTANQALTALNGADDQSRHAVLSLSTTTGAAFAVYAPPASKTYIVRNTSDHLATIYNATTLGGTTAAGSGVAIPAGKTLVVFSTGADFYTIDAANLTGTLAVANGGTGATTSTGTGSVVLSISPALTGVPTAPTATLGTNTTQMATTAFVQAALQAVYPVGSIYTNAGVATNPATLLGFGTWAAFGAGKVLVGQDTGDTAFDTLEETGGSKDAIVVSHTHTAATSVTDPGHRHRIAGGVGGAIQVLGLQSGTVAGIGPGSSGDYVDTYSGVPVMENAATGVTAATTVNSAGSSGVNANLQPYIVVKMWKRTA